MTLLVLLLSTNFLSWQLLRVSTYRTNRNTFYNRVMTDEMAIETRLHEYALGLSYGEKLFSVNQDVARDKFDTFYASNTEDQYPEILYLAYVKHVKDKTAFENQVKGDKSINRYGYPFFKIFPSTSAKEADVVAYVHPLEGNMSIFGYDVSSDDALRPYFEQARDNAEIVVTKRMDLRQKRRVVFIQLVYQTNMPNRTVAERRNAIDGYIVFSLNAETLFDKALEGEDDQNRIIIKVFPKKINKDGLLSTEILYENSADQINIDESEGYLEIKQIPVFGQTWTIAYNISLNNQVSLADKYAAHILFILSSLEVFALYVVINNELYGKSENAS